MVLTLAAVSGLLYVVAVIMFFALHLREPAVNWFRDPVSMYALGPGGRYFRIYAHVGTAAAGLLAGVFAISKSPTIPSVATVSMLLLLAFRLGVVLVPTDKQGSPRTSTGRLHLLFAVATFAATYTAIANASPILSAHSSVHLSAVLSWLQVTAMLSLAGVVATMFPPLKQLFGLLERVFLLSTMLWFIAANAQFLLAASAA